MSGIDAGSEWTTLLGGFLVAGRRRRPAQPGDRGRRRSAWCPRSGAEWPRGSTTRSARSVSRSASRSGARSSSAQGASKVSDLTAGTATASGGHPRQLVEAASSGSLHQAVAALPPQARQRRRTCRARGIPRRVQRRADPGRRGLLRRRRPGPLAGSRARYRARAGGAGVPARVRGDAAGRRRLGPASSTQTKRPPAGAASSRREGISVSRPWCRRGRSRSPSCRRPSRLPSSSFNACSAVG